MRKKKPTLADIARKLNLNKVSVSRALRDYPDISEKTKKKVRETAKVMGYMPNLVARSLASSCSKTIGVIVPQIAHNFFSRAVSGIQNIADSKGYEIVLSVSAESQELQIKQIQNLVAMQVDGLLISIAMETRDHSVFHWLREMQIPTVFFDRHIPDIGFNSVIIDDKKEAEKGVLNLIERGYKRIAHIAGDSHIVIGEKRRKGYEEALLKQGIQPDPDIIIEGGFGMDAGYLSFKKLMSKNVNFDALFVVTVSAGLGAYKAMEEIDPGLKDKITMMVFGDSGIGAVLPYPRFFINQSGITIGQKAIELLLSEIEGKIKPENLIEYVPTIVLEAGAPVTQMWDDQALPFSGKVESNRRD